jgi:hypothetical protein
MHMTLTYKIQKKLEFNFLLVKDEAYVVLRKQKFGSSWKWVVSYTALPLYSRWESPRHPLDRRLGGPQSPSDNVEEWKFLTLYGL